MGGEERECTARKREAAAKLAAKAKHKNAEIKAGPAAPAAPMEDIEEVRLRVRMALPSEDQEMEQSVAKTLLPPACSIWNNWRGQAWGVHLAGHERDSESWCELGRAGAAFAISARAWRLCLDDHGEPHDLCPIEGLLDNW